MKTLLVSGNTLQEWDVNEILSDRIRTKAQDIERFVQDNWDNSIGPYCGGLTYLEIEQLDNTFNNFR